MTIPDGEKQVINSKEKMKQLFKRSDVLKAISAVKELNKKFTEDEAKKKPLLEEASDSPVFIQVSMKKIPPKGMSKRIKVLLPHPIIQDTAEVCLFTGDLDKRNRKAEIDPDILHYKDLLKQQGITNITEVITLRQLRTEYKVYEARRQLMAAYDKFLCDKKIAQCLPRVLGKSFFQKRKFPIQISMDTPNLKNQVDKALSETVFTVNCRGSCCTSEVARLGMKDEDIVENVFTTVEKLSTELPGKMGNIFGIYLRTAKSQAIPIYISLESPNDVKIKNTRSREEVSFEELSTLPDAEVQVFGDGRIAVKRSNDEHMKEELNSEADSETEALTQSKELESMVKIIEDNSNKSKTKKGKRKGKEDTMVESEISPKTEQLEDIEIKEEDTNKIRVRKQKIKLEVKEDPTNKIRVRKQKIKLEVKEDPTLECEAIKKAMVETIQEGNSKRKTRKQKRKIEDKKDLTKVKCEDSSEKSEIEVMEENANKDKTKKRKLNEQNRKRKAPETLKNETSEPKAQKIKSVKKRQARVKS